MIASTPPDITASPTYCTSCAYKENEMQMFKGFSLIELLIAMSIASILMMVAGPLILGGINCKTGKIGWITRAKVTSAIGDIGALNLTLDRYRLSHNDQLPADLSDLVGNDRWGNPYQFLDFSTVNGNGPKRKNKSQVPVNLYFDMYSMGPDGKTATPMTSTPGADDIILVGNWIGVACLYGK